MTFKRFGEVLRELLLEAGYATKLGNPHWSRFAADVRGLHYETLRKAVAGDRQPTPDLMQKCAEELGVSPGVFFEYRVWRAQRAFDPREVGAAAAAAALTEWERLAEPAQEPPARRRSTTTPSHPRRS